MKFRKWRFVPAVAVVTHGLMQVRPAAAQLLANMNLNQEIVASDNSHGLVDTASYATTTTVPFQTNIAVNNGTGAFGTASYNITDSGSVATITITSSGGTSSYYDSFGESCGPRSDTLFNLLRPANATLTLHKTGPSNLETTLSDNGYLTLVGQNEGTLTATFAPGAIDLFEFWGIGEPNYGANPNQSGTYSFALTFTAIPEPSSAGLAIAAAATLLLRRRRRGEKLRYRSA